MSLTGLGPTRNGPLRIRGSTAARQDSPRIGASSTGVPTDAKPCGNFSADAYSHNEFLTPIRPRHAFAAGTTPKTRPSSFTKQSQNLKFHRILLPALRLALSSTTANWSSLLSSPATGGYAVACPGTCDVWNAMFTRCPWVCRLRAPAAEPGRRCWVAASLIVRQARLPEMRRDLAEKPWRRGQVKQIASGRVLRLVHHANKFAQLHVGVEIAEITLDVTGALQQLPPRSALGSLPSSERTSLPGYARKPPLSNATRSTPTTANRSGNRF